MSEATLILEDFLDLADTDEKLLDRMYAPVIEERTTWICRIEIGSPIDETSDVRGEGALQALSLALKNLSARLYSHHLYREGKLGAYGEFGDFLGLPAPTTYLEFAPFPF
jgi:hypothetical protein